MSSCQHRVHKRILITGGAGFVGSAVVRLLAAERQAQLCNVDALTYAGNLTSIASAEHYHGYRFVKADVCDGRALLEMLNSFKPDAVVHLAAESHVDRSLVAPAPFVQTNVVGTTTLLEAVTLYWQQHFKGADDIFRLLHVSSDEVYGSLGTTGSFSETAPYAPRSPYSASKAAADHFVRAWHNSYGLPVVICNCCNNYGPYQHPEKLVPLLIINALEHKPLPLYGHGENTRDWIYVDDHVRALLAALSVGVVGETYNIGANCERTNIEMAHLICEVLERLQPRTDGGEYRDLITFVADRPGHDWRYAMDATKIRRELGWQPLESFASGLTRTVQWYIENCQWWQPLHSDTKSVL